MVTTATPRHVDIDEVLNDVECIKLLFQDLCGSGFSRVLVVLKSLELLSENRDDLKMLVNHGLTIKVCYDVVYCLLIVCLFMVCLFVCLFRCYCGSKLSMTC